LFGNGFCSLSATDAGAFIHTSISSAVRRMTGMAFSCTTFTVALGNVVKKQ
jgi:hypothetical protein